MLRDTWLGFGLIALLGCASPASHADSPDVAADALADAQAAETSESVDASESQTPDATVDATTPAEPEHPHAWPAAALTYTDVRPILTKYCASCHASTVAGAARQGAPAHETLDDPDGLRTEIPHLLDYTTDPPSSEGLPMPPAGSPQPTSAERALLVQWLNEGAKTQADFCFRDFAKGTSRIVTVPTAGGRPDVHLNHNGIYTPAAPDVLQKGDLIQGRFPVPAGSPFHLHATRPPLGYARHTVSMQWMRGCLPAPPPPGAVLAPDGELTWTPTEDQVDDYVVQLNAEGGDEGREIVVAVRPSTPSNGCHDDSDSLQVVIVSGQSTGDAGSRLSIQIHNAAGMPITLTEVAVRGYATGGAPDVLYPALQGVNQKTLQPGETKTVTSLVCAYPSLDLPNRPVRYAVTASGTFVGSGESVCGSALTAPSVIPGAEPAPPGRELPQVEEVARLMGLLQEDATTKALMVGDYNKDGLIDLAYSQMGHATRVLLAKGDQLHFELASTLAYDGTLGIAAGLIDLMGDGNQSIVSASWPDLFDLKKFEPKVQLLRNDGLGNFSLDLDLFQMNLHIAGRNLNVLDMDNDGFEDLYVTTVGGIPDQNENHPPGYQVPTNLLYRNAGDGSFAEIGAAAGARGTTTASGLAVLDANEDGWPDLWMNGYEQPLLLINQADGTFAPQALDFTGWAFFFMDPAQNTKLRFGTWMNGWGDFNADGHTDIVVGPMLYRGAETPEHVWIGDGKGGFKLDSTTCNLGQDDPCLSWSMGLQVGDLNDDGYPEIYMGGGEPSMGWHHQMWLNVTAKPGDMPHFLDRTAALDFPASGAATRFPYRGHGGTMLDVDGDMDLDFVQCNGGMDPDGSDPGAREAWRVFLNRGTPHGKLELDLRGFPSNLNAVGARVEVFLAGGTGPQKLRQWMFPNNGFGGSHLAGRLHFGLYDAKQIERVEVLWPDGQVTVHHPQVNSRAAILEQDAILFGTDFRKGLDGFAGGGTLTHRALCMAKDETAAHAVVGATTESSLAARADFPSGADSGQVARLAMTAGGSAATLTLSQGKVVLQMGDGKSASAQLSIKQNRRFLARVALEKTASGATDAVGYLDTREVVRVPSVTAFAPTTVSVGGTSACWSMLSVR